MIELPPRIVRVIGSFYTVSFQFKEYTFVVVKENGKWYVKSEKTGKKLAGPYDSKDKAAARLKQIDFFKWKNSKKQNAETAMKNAFKNIMDAASKPSDDDPDEDGDE